MKIDRKWAAGLALFAALAFLLFPRKPANNREEFREIAPITGPIETSVSVTGVIQPQTRLEIKPPIAGRIDSILVKEGQRVAVGDVLATMSSTERAALMDAALSKGREGLAEWGEVYKPIPLVAPIAGEVIVQIVRPGQAVTAADAVVVLSDRLIVQAQVDETDIGKVKKGQQAVITLDAYPDVEAKAAVDHIYFESKTVNNVTIYPVDILPAEIPPVFRSGMSANVKITGEKRDEALLLPAEAVKRDPQGSYVLMRAKPGAKPERRAVVTGLADDARIEIVSGLKEGDRVVIVRKKGSGPARPGGSPLVPSYGRRPARSPAN